MKSLGGISLESSPVEARGLRHDRRWILVDEDGVFLTQRTFARMALFRLDLVEPDGLGVTGPDGTRIKVLFDSTIEPIAVRVWSSDVQAVRVSQEADDWFSFQLGRSARLAYMPDDSIRPTNPSYTQPGDHVGFADAYPILVISQASLDDLNERLEVAVPMNRFRPNIVVEGTRPYEEDDWSSLTIGNVRLRRAKRCGRCRVTTTNQETGEVGIEPLRTLATYRRENNNVVFGTYFVPECSGVISKGQECKFEFDPALPVAAH